jgi:hypothetical protein
MMGVPLIQMQTIIKQLNFTKLIHIIACLIKEGLLEFEAIWPYLTPLDTDIEN